MLSVRQSLTVLGGQPHFTTPKTRRGERHITLSRDVLEVLAGHKQRQKAEAAALGDAWTDTGLIFTSEVGTLIHPRNFERTFKTLLSAAKVTPARFHDLRHLHVSLLVPRGFDARLIADRVGHANPSFTMDVYSHMFDTQRQDANVGMADLLGTSVRHREIN